MYFRRVYRSPTNPTLYDDLEVVEKKWVSWPNYYYFTSNPNVWYEAPPPPRTIVKYNPQAAPVGPVAPQVPSVQPVPAVPTPQVTGAIAPITGRRLALLVGINYRGTNSQLEGCVNDTVNMSNFLRLRGYTTQVILTDEAVAGRNGSPTKTTIMNNLKTMLSSLRPGDSFFFQFSGHGSNRAAPGKPEETDGRDECLCPLDYTTAGMIWDDDLRKLIDLAPVGSRVTLFMDCCHSGSNFDLPVNVDVRNRGRESSLADVVMISGCKDEGTSADAVIDGKPCGAATASFLKTYSPAKTIMQVVKDMRTFLVANRFHQVPMLSYSRTFPIDTKFTL